MIKKWTTNLANMFLKFTLNQQVDEQPGEDLIQTQPQLG